MSSINEQQGISQQILTSARSRSGHDKDRYRRGILFQRLSRWWIYVLLILVSLIFIFPFLWLATSSLKNEFQYYAIPIQWIPNPLEWDNFKQVFVDYNFIHYLFNSIWLAAYCVVAATLSSSIVAYGFARFHFPGRGVLFVILIATIILPVQILTISLYTLFRGWGWIDTFLPIMVPKLFGDAFSIFLFRQFFIGLPREIDEAARIDGCGSFRIYWNIVLPQSKPVIIVVAIFAFLSSWRDAWNPLIYLSSDANRTVPLGLFFFTSPYRSVDPQLMAATLVALAVPVVLYALGQRYIDSGVAIAEIK